MVGDGGRKSLPIMGEPIPTAHSFCARELYRATGASPLTLRAARPTRSRTPSTLRSFRAATLAPNHLTSAALAAGIKSRCRAFPPAEYEGATRRGKRSVVKEEAKGAGKGPGKGQQRQGRGGTGQIGRGKGQGGPGRQGRQGGSAHPPTEANPQRPGRQRAGREGGKQGRTLVRSLTNETWLGVQCKIAKAGGTRPANTG